MALTLFPLPLAADAVATIDKYRGSFEKRMNAELDEHGKAARDLRVKYLEALRKLKLELGRAENLKGAAEVVAELEAVEDGEETEELPADADYRLKRLRDQWDRGLVGIRRERTKKLNETVKLYFQALDKEKRRLTRAGKIKDALLVEEEQKRVKELPEVKAVIAPKVTNPLRVVRGIKPSGDVALATKGAKAKGQFKPHFLIDGRWNVEHDYASGDIPSEFIVVLDEVYALSAIRVRLWQGDSRKYTYKLETSEDGRRWELLADLSSSPSRGLQIHELEPRDVRFIKLTGLSNSRVDNNQFHVLEIEAR